MNKIEAFKTRLSDCYESLIEEKRKEKIGIIRNNYLNDLIKFVVNRTLLRRRCSNMKRSHSVKTNET